MYTHVSLEDVPGTGTKELGLHPTNSTQTVVHGSCAEYSQLVIDEDTADRSQLPCRDMDGMSV